ncbi:MAG: energy transducer TonB [Sphingomonas sp.]|nr:energy transducer TonB [Sphingomonas sp.]
MPIARPADHDRVKAAVAAVLVQLLLGYAIITGLAVPLPQALPRTLQLFTLASPPKPPAPQPKNIQKAAPKRAAAAAPPNLRATATDIVVPPLIVPRPEPPPVVVALKPNVEIAPASGASSIRGPGSGNGGIGDGTGSGGAGDGDGGGAPLRRTGGRITGRDYPEGPYRAGIGGTLYVHYVVGVKGRVTACRVVRSSGNAELDDTTCRLITERFRYKPRRDAEGKPIPTVIVEDHTWVVDRAPHNEEGVPGQDPDTP